MGLGVTRECVREIHLRLILKNAWPSKIKHSERAQRFKIQIIERTCLLALSVTHSLCQCHQCSVTAQLLRLINTKWTPNWIINDTNEWITNTNRLYYKRHEQHTELRVTQTRLNYKTRTHKRVNYKRHKDWIISDIRHTNHRQSNDGLSMKFLRFWGCLLVFMRRWG